MMQVVGAVGLVLLLATGELAPTNVLGFCVAASNAFGLIAGKCFKSYRQKPPTISLQHCLSVRREKHHEGVNQLPHVVSS